MAFVHNTKLRNLLSFGPEGQELFAAQNKELAGDLPIVHGAEMTVSSQSGSGEGVSHVLRGIERPRSS